MELSQLAEEYLRLIKRYGSPRLHEEATVYINDFVEWANRSQFASLKPAITKAQ